MSRWNEGTHPWFKRAAEYRRTTLSYGDAMSRKHGPYIRLEDAMDEGDKVEDGEAVSVKCTRCSTMNERHYQDDHEYGESIPFGHDNTACSNCLSCQRKRNIDVSPPKGIYGPTRWLDWEPGDV